MEPGNAPNPERQKIIEETWKNAIGDISARGLMEMHRRDPEGFDRASTRAAMAVDSRLVKEGFEPEYLAGDRYRSTVRGQLGTIPPPGMAELTAGVGRIRGMIGDLIGAHSGAARGTAPSPEREPDNGSPAPLHSTVRGQLGSLPAPGMAELTAGVGRIRGMIGDLIEAHPGVARGVEHAASSLGPVGALFSAGLSRAAAPSPEREPDSQPALLRR